MGDCLWFLKTPALGIHDDHDFLNCTKICAGKEVDVTVPLRRVTATLGNHLVHANHFWNKLFTNGVSRVLLYKSPTLRIASP